MGTMSVRLQLELTQNFVFRGNYIGFIIWGIDASIYSGLISPVLQPYFNLHPQMLDQWVYNTNFLPVNQTV